jgi:hypothetical protein
MQIGRDVPWVTAWSSELDVPDQWRHCDYAGEVAIWRPETPGVGLARFKALHEVRQRRAVKELLCQVCGRRTPSHDRWLFAKGGWQPDPDNGGWMWCTDDAPVHRACGNLVRLRCPFIREGGVEMVRFPKTHRTKPAISPATGRVLMLLIVPPYDFAVKAFGPPPA